MGNKQTGGGSHHLAEPTSRSFSWQPDPLFAGEPVKRGASFTGSGPRPGDQTAVNSLAPSHRTVPYAASEYGSGGVYRHRQASSPNLATGNGNGSVVRGDAAFGGVQKESIKQGSKKKTASGKRGNLANTVDSGYVTEITPQDSDKSARTRLRGSRLSLNDAMLNEYAQHQPPPMLHPAAMPICHPFMPLPPPNGMIPLGPPPGFMPPPDPFLYPPMLNCRGMDEKKAKKLRKKQQKNQHQQLGRQSMAGEMMPPGAYALVPAGPLMGYGPPQPPPHQLSNFRSHSIDNFMAAGLIQPGQMVAAPPPHLQALPAPYPVRRFSSHVDISQMGVDYRSATLGPPTTAGPPTVTLASDNREKVSSAKKERKYEKRRDQQLGSLRDSSLGSSRGRLTDSTFSFAKNDANKNREERFATAENKKPTDGVKQATIENGTMEKGNHILNVSSENAKPLQRSEVIYETLKGAKRAILAASAQMDAINQSGHTTCEKLGHKPTVSSAESSSQESPPPPTPKPVVITPEAKAILERNARILVDAEREHQEQQPIDNSNEPVIAKRIEKQEAVSRPPAPMSKMEEDLRKIPTPPPPPPAPPPPAQLQHVERISSEEKSSPKRLPERDSMKNDIINELRCTRIPEMKAQAHKIEEQKLPDSAPESQRFKINNSNERSSIDDRNDIESMIEAILNPILPRRKYKRPQEFEPLDAWRGINVQQELAKRQPQRLENPNRDQHSIIEERIQVRLVPTPPSRREQHSGEPIYLEYDERLPEFKKRLIETGSFDIPEAEKFHHRSTSLLSGGSKGRLDLSPSRWEGGRDLPVSGPMDTNRHGQPQIWRDYVAMEQAATGQGSVRSRKTMDSNKGSLRKLRESVANIFRTKSTDQLKPGNGHPLSTATDEIPPSFAPPAGGRYAASLTPSTSKIKAGDSSDIDFSWVHDLETRFRLEREQFERELQTLKQKSATLQRNDYVLSPKLQRQHSYQPTGVEAEMDRDENHIPPSLRKASLNTQQDNYRTNYRNIDKNYSSSINLATSTPPSGRMSVYHSQQALNDVNVAAIRAQMDSHAKQKYFGIYDAQPSAAIDHHHELGYTDAYERSFSKELQQLAPVNVRQKAAQFEHESQRVQREMEERNQQLTKQRQYRSSSAPQRSLAHSPYRFGVQQQHSIDADEPIYIPRPDYDENASFAQTNRLINAVQHDRPNSASRTNSGDHHQEKINGPDFIMASNIDSRHRNGIDDRLFAPPYADEPLMISTGAMGANQRAGYSSSPRSPSERRLARFNHSNANYLSTNNVSSRRATSGHSTSRYESQPVLPSTAAGPGGRHSPRGGRYSPGSRSPRVLRAQQMTHQQYLESDRNNVHWSRNVIGNGYDDAGQQAMIKGNAMGQRLVNNGPRGVAFVND